MDDRRAMSAIFYIENKIKYASNMSKALKLMLLPLLLIFLYHAFYLHNIIIQSWRCLDSTTPNSHPVEKTL